MPHLIVEYSAKELTREINAFVEQYSAQASPFAWIATAESILAKIQRICSFVSAPRH